MKAVRFDRPPGPEGQGYPFDIPALRSLDRLELHPAVSFFVGENGSGKSTLLEAMARKLGFMLTQRLQGDGVYLFDEPEAALSPQRQLSVLTLLHRLVYHRSQLVIATHSPILLAYPNARIYEFGDHGIRPTTFTETEQFQVTRDFLNRHERMVDVLLQAEEAELRSRQR